VNFVGILQSPWIYYVVEPILKMELMGPTDYMTSHSSRWYSS